MVGLSRKHRTGQVLGCALPVPAIFPAVHVAFSQYFAFDLNWPALHAAVYILYYFALEPTAAVSAYLRTCRFRSDIILLAQALYLPQMTVSLLTATAFSYTPDALKYAAAIHISSWIAQFIGHYGPEGRSPALIDNLVGGKQIFCLPVRCADLSMFVMLSCRPRPVLCPSRDLVCSWV